MLRGHHEPVILEPDRAGHCQIGESRDLVAVLRRWLINVWTAESS